MPEMRYLFGSVARISDLPQRPFEGVPLEKTSWETGDYVIGEVMDVSGLHTVELPNGRMMEATEGDLVVGALGARAATLEAVGDWRAVTDDRFDALTPAGLFGRITSASPFLPKLMALRYVGHVLVDGVKQTMALHAGGVSDAFLTAPVVLITGTSMSSGKTTSGRLIVRLLARRGLRVVGAKLTGAARYRDVLSFKDAGAAEVFDFVDVGLPSTVVDPQYFAGRCEELLRRIAAAQPDVVVAEAGASPLESYNGKAAMAVLGDRVRFSLVCASDPYAVAGIVSAFAREPDLVAGGAANTTAAIDLVRDLTGLTAMNLMNRASHEPLLELLLEKLALGRA